MVHHIIHFAYVVFHMTHSTYRYVVHHNIHFTYVVRTSYYPLCLCGIPHDLLYLCGTPYYSPCLCCILNNPCFNTNSNKKKSVRLFYSSKSFKVQSMQKICDYAWPPNFDSYLELMLRYSPVSTPEFELLMFTIV